MDGQRDPAVSFHLTTEGRCMTLASHWERTPPGVTQRTNSLLQPMEFLGDSAICPDVHGVPFRQYTQLFHKFFLEILNPFEIHFEA